MVGTTGFKPGAIESVRSPPRLRIDLSCGGTQSPTSTHKHTFFTMNTKQISPNRALALDAGATSAGEDVEYPPYIGGASSYCVYWVFAAWVRDWMRFNMTWEGMRRSWPCWVVGMFCLVCLMNVSSLRSLCKSVCFGLVVDWTNRKCPCERPTTRNTGALVLEGDGAAVGRGSKRIGVGSPFVGEARATCVRMAGRKKSKTRWLGVRSFAPRILWR